MSNVIASAALFSGGGLPLGGLLKFHAERTPKAAAVIFSEAVVTFEDLDARSNRRARALARLGVKAGDFVTVGLANGVEFYETTFAIWKLGAVPNIVSYRLAQPEIDAIVDLVRPSAVIGVAAPQLKGRASVPAGLAPDLSSAANALPENVAPHWKAMTSGGSTGRPKVILDAMPGRWSPDQFALGQSQGDVILNPGPLYHNAPFIGTHFGLFAGSTVVEMGRFDAERALALIQSHKVTWVNFVPTMMHRIWRLGRDVLDRYDLSSLKVVFHMAAPCPIWLKEAWIEWLGPERIFELYAGTERQGTTVITGREWLERKGSVGRAQPGSRIAILDEAGDPCPPGEVGEIYFLPDAGPSSTYAYLGSEARRRGAWESLGDLGRLDADGYLYLSDRRSDLILSGGANVYPAEVEAALDAHPEVLSSIVVGLPDEDLGERVHAIVQRARGADLEAEALLAFAATLLARYKLPRSVEFTIEPLRDDAGKARRSALKAERSHQSAPGA